MPVMGRAFSSRLLLAICGALMVLLIALAVLQYRWSDRVAQADLQREREYLESASTLFSREVAGVIAQATVFLQEDALAALSSGKPTPALPDILEEVYFLELSADGASTAQRLTDGGSFTPSPLPEWLGSPRCAMLLQDKPPTLITPVYDALTDSSFADGETRILRTFRWRPDRCFVARLDEAHLREALFPDILRQTFGEAASSEYEFAVASVADPDELVFGEPVRADFQKRFGSTPNRLTVWQSSTAELSPRPSGMIVERRERIIGVGAETPAPPDPRAEIWELQVSRKGGPLAEAFEQRRRRELALAFGIEGLLLAAVAFLLVGVRRLQLLAEQKMQFVAGVSHELRTPASAIAMLARNQADGLVTEPDKVRQYGELIHQQSRRLNETVEQTLQFAGIHSGFRRPQKNRIALRPILEEVVEARRDEMQRSGVELELAIDDDLPEAAIDAGLVRTAVDNLLSNALKHAESGRWIRLSVSRAPNADEVRISVEDRGPGIDPNDKEEIFQPFWRGRAAMDGQVPGSGIGLSLVRTAAEAHGGAVTVESQPGRGSVFTLHLPL